MAKATSETETTIKSVTLTLSLTEARTLRAVLSLVGGFYETSPRRCASDIADALDAAGIPAHNDSPEWFLVDRTRGTGIYFSNYPQET